MVSTHPKNISQTGSCPQVGVKIKNLWNHHLDELSSWTLFPAFFCQHLGVICGSAKNMPCIKPQIFRRTWRDNIHAKAWTTSMPGNKESQAVLNGCFMKHPCFTWKFGVIQLNIIISYYFKVDASGTRLLFLGQAVCLQPNQLLFPEKILAHGYVGITL